MGKKIKDNFVPLTWEMMRSDSFRDLSGNALKGWTIIKYVQWERDRNGRKKNPNPKEVKVGPADAKRFGMTRNTWYRAVEELETAGMIVIISKGGFHHQLAIYSPCDDWKLPRHLRATTCLDSETQ